MGQDIIANALPYLGLLLVNIHTATPSSANLNNRLFLSTPKQQIVWVVRENESLLQIAADYYGSKDYLRILLDDNSFIKDPNIIEVGWKLKLRPIPLESRTIKKPQERKDQTKSTTIARIPSLTAANSTVPSTALQPSNEPLAASESNPTPPSNYDEVYKQAGSKYNVPWQILYGIHLTETGLRNGEIYNRQGSGAQGPMQFMPGTWRAYGVDGNGDGVVDINNAVDSIYAAANYLAKHGSLSNGLKYYGGNTYGTLSAARSRGFTQM